MRLTLHTDYALRLLMLLAIEPDRRRTVEDAAKCFDISRNHLMKVAQTLAQAGILESLRGRGGGLRLARSPSSINLGAVLRATEDNLALVECFNREHNRCLISAVCGLRGPLEEALHAFLEVLDRYSLEDLIKSPVAVRRIRTLLARQGNDAMQVRV